MILNRPLTIGEQHRSQHYFRLFSYINGVSYVCLGESVIILFACRLNCPNFIISALGGMIFFGYALLPLGKTVTARAGAARCQEFFWIVRNITSFFVAAAAPVFYLLHWTYAAWGMILAGAFIFYGARAAGLVAVTPLYGEIASEQERSRLLAQISGIFYIMSSLALGGIVVALRISNNDVRVLAGIIIVGGITGILSSRCLRKIDETGALRDASRNPSGADVRELLSDPLFRKQIGANWIVNLSIILMVPISLLAVKRGYVVSDTTAMLFCLFQYLAGAAGSFLAAKPIRKIGSRRFTALMFALLLCVGPLWYFAPASRMPLHLGIVFFLCGACNICMINSLAVYFLQMTKDKLQVTASILLALIAGAGAAVPGIFLSGFLLESLVRIAGPHPLDLYRLYFIIASVLLLPGILLITRLKPMPIEKRKSWKPFSWFAFR